VEIAQGYLVSIAIVCVHVCSPMCWLLCMAISLQF